MQHSSAEQVGDIVTQIIGFKSGHKKTWHRVKTKTIEQSEFTRFDLVDGRRVYVKTDEVEWFEVMTQV
jgi:hypothetical protein